MKLLIHSQTSMVKPLKFGNWLVISSDVYKGCNYLSMPGLKLIHASKSGPMSVCRGIMTKIRSVRNSGTKKSYKTLNSNKIINMKVGCNLVRCIAYSSTIPLNFTSCSKYYFICRTCFNIVVSWTLYTNIYKYHTIVVMICSKKRKNTVWQHSVP